MLLRSPGPISPDTYSGHIRRRALCPNRLRNGMSQRSSSSCQSDILPTMVGPSKSRPPMSHRKTDLGIPCRSKSAKVVLISRNGADCLRATLPVFLLCLPPTLGPGAMAKGQGQHAVGQIPARARFCRGTAGGTAAKWKFFLIAWGHRRAARRYPQIYFRLVLDLSGDLGHVLINRQPCP